MRERLARKSSADSAETLSVRPPNVRSRPSYPGRRTSGRFESTSGAETVRVLVRERFRARLQIAGPHTRAPRLRWHWPSTRMRRSRQARLTCLLRRPSLRPRPRPLRRRPAPLQPARPGRFPPGPRRQPPQPRRCLASLRLLLVGPTRLRPLHPLLRRHRARLAQLLRQLDPPRLPTPRPRLRAA